MDVQFRCASLSWAFTGRNGDAALLQARIKEGGGRNGALKQIVATLGLIFRNIYEIKIGCIVTAKPTRQASR